LFDLIGVDPIPGTRWKAIRRLPEPAAARRWGQKYDFAGKELFGHAGQVRRPWSRRTAFTMTARTSWAAVRGELE